MHNGVCLSVTDRIRTGRAALCRRAVCGCGIFRSVFLVEYGKKLVDCSIIVKMSERPAYSLFDEGNTTLHLSESLTHIIGGSLDTDDGVNPYQSFGGDNHVAATLSSVGAYRPYHSDIGNRF